MKYLVALLLLAWPLAAAAQPRSISDCEKVTGDLAYNQCLASFGPTARSGAARSSAGEVDAGDQAPAQEPQRGGAMRRGRGSYGHPAEKASGRRRGGRQSMTFDIVGGGSELKASGRTRSHSRPSRRRR
jgi:hypothetical protein